MPAEGDYVPLTRESLQARAEEIARLAHLGPRVSLVALPHPIQASLDGDRVIPGIARYRRYFDGLEVIGGIINVETKLDGSVADIRIRNQDVSVQSSTPSFPLERATRIALAYSELREPTVIEHRLMIFASDSGHPDIEFKHPLLVWRIHLRSPDNMNEHILIHAHTGHFLFRCPLDILD